MKNSNEKSKEAVWQLIDKEKQRDRFIKRVSKVAWVVTLLMLTCLLVLGAIELGESIQRYNRSSVFLENVIEDAVPLLGMVGVISFIIAILSTVGMFMRLRTTSLLEIQQRLANLEEMVISQDKS